MAAPPTLDQARIGLVGLGYVGLPLAVEFGKHYDTVGFDVQQARIAALRAGRDVTREVSPEELAAATRLRLTTDPADLATCNVYIVTVPTPIDAARRPDLRPLVSASETLGKVLKAGDTVVYESTVYPGCTEEVCVPILERESGLTFNVDFFAGYSPERINPGDKEHRVTSILKVTSGSTPQVADFVDALYGSIIEAGIHRASSIKVAEAAKVIENTQRDVNIALMNEISKIFDRIGIRTSEVLEAAGTKWNFLKFHPGLVGGHCIGVDPYYLTAKAEQLGYHPQVILSGRRINDGMGAYVAQRVVKLLARRDQPIRNARVGILGFTFKENVPDIRNSKIVDIYRELRAFGIEPMVHDPVADPKTVEKAYDVELCDLGELTDLSALIVAVAHDQFSVLDGARLNDMIAADGVVVDVRSKIDPASLRPDLCYWSL